MERENDLISYSTAINKIFSIIHSDWLVIKNMLVCLFYLVYPTYLSPLATTVTTDSSINFLTVCLLASWDASSMSVWLNRSTTHKNVDIDAIKPVVSVKAVRHHLVTVCLQYQNLLRNRSTSFSILCFALLFG